LHALALRLDASVSAATVEVLAKDEMQQRFGRPPAPVRRRLPW
jgi:hypothetical protein